MTEKGRSTQSVHGSSRPGKGSLTTPIHQTSTFVLASAQDVDDVYEGRAPGHVYSRYGNPSLEAPAARIARLERGDGALLTSSGMAAISTAVLAFARSGGRVVSVRELYGNTARLFEEHLPRLGVRVDFVPGVDPKALEREITRSPAPDLVYLETPTNPTLKVADLRAAADAARRVGTPTLVDSTFATPVNSRPRDLGIDVVLHSATKYLSGHADVTAGAIVAGEAHLARISALHRILGGVLDPHAAFLLERGLKTLPMRVRAANANAQAVAEALERNPKVSRVHYPGLPSHPQHELARSQMPGGFGGLLSFDLAAGTKASAMRFMDALEVYVNAASLGGVESLVSIPVQQSHRGANPEALAAAGITPGTVRLACGIEDADELIADVERALATV